MSFISDGYLNTLGFTIYCYEGIGIVMPVLATTENPERFKSMLIYAFITLTVIFIVFAEMCYISWGSTLDEAIVTQMLPRDNVAVILIKFLFSLNLVFSYSIVIYPANLSVETLFCGRMKKNTQKLYWL